MTETFLFDLGDTMPVTPKKETFEDLIKDINDDDVKEYNEWADANPVTDDQIRLSARNFVTAVATGDNEATSYISALAMAFWLLGRNYQRDFYVSEDDS